MMPFLTSNSIPNFLHVFVYFQSCVIYCGLVLSGELPCIGDVTPSTRVFQSFQDSSPPLVLMRASELDATGLLITTSL